jgi:hypothetical protein
MSQTEYNLNLRSNTYTTEPVRRELFNPFLQMDQNRVLMAIAESRLPPERLQEELQGIVNRLEYTSFIPMKETKSIGAIAGIEEGKIVPQPLPIEDVRAELDAKYALAVKLYGEQQVEQYARQTNEQALQVLQSLVINPKVASEQDNIYLSLPKTTLDDQGIMVPVVNFIMAAKIRPLAGMDVPQKWTDPYAISEATS